MPPRIYIVYGILCEAASEPQRVSGARPDIDWNRSPSERDDCRRCGPPVGENRLEIARPVSSAARFTGVRLLAMTACAAARRRQPASPTCACRFQRVDRRSRRPVPRVARPRDRGRRSRPAQDTPWPSRASARVTVGNFPNIRRVTLPFGRREATTHVLRPKAICVPLVGAIGVASFPSIEPALDSDSVA